MIEVQTNDSLTTITLDHGKVNAMDLELLHELIDVVTTFESSQASGAILTGRRSTFSAGVDLFRVVNEGQAYLEQFIPKLTAALLKLFTVSKPLVAAINGHALAGGALLALACDYKIMAKGTGNIGIPELLVGVPFPSIALEIARFSLPRHVFQQLIYSGKTPAAEEAAALGLVEQTVAPERLLPAATKVLLDLTKIPAKSFAATKRLMRQPALDNHQKYKETLDAAVTEIWASGQTREILSAYLAKVTARKA